MSKEKFLMQLQKGLTGLPQDEINERLTFYSEMIDDRIDEGLTEDEAVAEIGSVQAVVTQILADTPSTRLVKECEKPKRSLKSWEILLLVLGAPLWFSLLITIFALLFAFNIVLWSLAISFWSVMVAMFFSGLGVMFSAVVIAIQESVLTGLTLFFAGMCLTGLSIFMFIGCKAATEGILYLTKKIALGIKSLFVRKETVS